MNRLLQWSVNRAAAVLVFFCLVVVSVPQTFSSIIIAGQLLVDLSYTRGVQTATGLLATEISVTNWINYGALGGSFGLVSQSAYAASMGTAYTNPPNILTWGTNTTPSAPGTRMLVANFPTPPQLQGASPYSIEVWFWNNGDNTYQRGLFAWTENAPTDGNNAGKFCAGVPAAHHANNNGGAIQAPPDLAWYTNNIPTNGPPVGAWHYGVLTYDGTTETIYLDGTNMNSQKVALNISAATYYPMLFSGIITAAPYQSSYSFSGGIAAVRVHSAALGSGDVAKNYAAGIDAVPVEVVEVGVYASPLVSYQYLDQVVSPPGQPNVASALVSYQYCDWPYGASQEIWPSPNVSYSYQVGSVGLTLSSPNGGENWTAGTTRAVTWAVSGGTSEISYYWMDYSLNGGATWLSSVLYGPASATSVAWPIPPNATSTLARVRVRAMSSSGAVVASGTGAANFTISSAAAHPTAVPDVSNLAPVSGEQVYFTGQRSTASTNGSVITLWSWDFGDGTTGTGSTLSHVYYSASGGAARTVALTVTDSTGKTDTESLTLYVTGQALGNSQQQQAFSKDPVNLATGNYAYDHVDLRIPGRGLPFEFRRFYNSKDTTGSGLPLGFGWTHSYNIRLAINESNSAVIVFGDGHQETYATNGFGGYTSEPGVFSALTSSSGTFSLTTKDQQEYSFDAQGRLASIADKNSNAITLAYTNGNLSAITDTVGRTIIFIADTNNCLTQITDPLGRTVQFAYDANTNLIRVTNLRGGMTQFAYDAYHQITNAIDPRGNAIVSMVYDAQRRVVSSQRDALLNATTFDYDFVSRVTTVTDPYGSRSYNYYDERLRVVRIVDALGSIQTFEYDANNNRTKVVDKNGGANVYSYDANGNVTSKTDPLGNTTSIAYDARNNPANRLDALDGLSLFKYDSAGNLTNTLNALGKTSILMYDSFGQPRILINPNGNRTTNTYDSFGNLIAIQNALGGSNTFAYDIVGRKLSQVDALGRTNLFYYDDADNLIAFVNAQNKTNAFTYDANNNRVTATDFLQNTTTNVYDQKDRLVVVRDPIGDSVTNEYDALDRRTRVIDARGGNTQYGYDAVGNLVALTNAAGEVTRYTCDGNGNRTSVTDPLGNVTTNAFDAMNRLVFTQDALGHGTTNASDSLGRRIETMDALGRHTYLTYDAIGRCVQFRDAAGGTVTYTYDDVGNRTSTTDPAGHTTTNVFDALNRLVSITNPDNGATHFRYDAAGNVTNKTDPNGQIIAYSYDANNRITNITYPAGTPVTFAYDANGNRTSMTDGLGTSIFLYDALNRMTNATDCFGQAIAYGYDAGGNRTSVTYPDGKTVEYSYDAMNRVQSVTDWLGNATVYAYDLAGNLAAAVNPNGTAASYQYDAANRLVGLTNSAGNSTVIASYQYTLDAVGNQIQSSQIEQLQTTPVVGQFSYAYDNDNRMVTSEGQAQVFDANGNMVSISATNLLFYDYENRLTESVLAGATNSYQYDGLGYRMSASRNGLVARYVLDRNTPLTQVLAETDAAGTIIAYYVYGLGLISRIDSSSNAQYYHFDSRGSTVALTDTSGQITDAYAYDPFGQPRSASGSTENRFRYLARHGVVDEGNALLYIRARFYSARQGRFVTKDPATGRDGDSQSLNRYIYALNNPVRLIDITGLSAQEASSFALPLASSDNSIFHNYLISLSTRGLAPQTPGSEHMLVSANSQLASVASIGDVGWDVLKGFGNFIVQNASDLYKLVLNGVNTPGSISPVSAVTSIGITVLENSPELAQTAIDLRNAEQLQLPLYAETYKSLGFSFQDAYNQTRAHFGIVSEQAFRQAWDNASSN